MVTVVGDTGHSGGSAANSGPLVANKFQTGFDQPLLSAMYPAKTEPDALIIPGTTDEFMLAYYLPFLTIIELSDHGPDTAATVTGGFGTFGQRVDMLSSVYQRVQRATQERDLGGPSENIQRLLDQAPLRDLGLLADGTAAGTAWTEAVAGAGLVRGSSVLTGSAPRHV